MSHVARFGSAQLRDHLLILIIVLGSRSALYAAGLRFNLDLGWMFLSDPSDLRERPFETVYFFHAFAPGMNLITGGLLKIAPGHLATAAALVFSAFGWLLAASLYQILKTLGNSRWSSLTLAVAFSLLPQTLFLENLFLYTYLCAALLCFSAALFHHALCRASTLSWLGFFLTCTALGWLYTVFHLIWFAAMLVVALSLASRDTRRRVVLGAALPALLLVGLYTKNFALFGVFGATSWGGANLTLVTTQQMSPVERNEWIRDGRLSPYAGISAYAPPSEYLRFFPEDLHFPWPGSNELVRASVNEGNFNHGLFLQVNRARSQDAAYFIQTRPGEYLGRVFTENLPSLFHSTTHWHPHDRRPNSPHRNHREVLGKYEQRYDSIVHGWPVPGVGLYAFLPPFLVWALLSVSTGLRAADRAERAGAALLGFCLLQIAFVVTTSSLFTAWEASRYRFAVEPCIWIVVAVALRAAYQRVRGWLPGLGRAPT